MNVLYAETEVVNDVVKTTKRPCFTQFDRHHPANKTVTSDFERFFYVQRDPSDQIIDVYVQRKGLYTAESGNVETDMRFRLAGSGIVKMRKARTIPASPATRNMTRQGFKWPIRGTAMLSMPEVAVIAQPISVLATALPVAAPHT